MFEVLTAHGADALRWQHVWDRLPHDLRDVHYCPAYGRVQEALGGSARCAVYEWEAWVIMQPFMLREIGETGYRDMTSMYGHGGPLSNMRSLSARALMEWMEVEFARWRSEQRVVSEFCALHPILADDQRRLVHPDAVLRDVRQTVAMRVDCTDEVIAAGMRADRRQNLAKAANLYMVEGANWLPFCALYAETMRRHDAPSRFQFSNYYFTTHGDHLWPDRMAILFCGEKINTVRAASLILFGHHHAHYHFTGTADDMPRGANDRIIMEAARLARRAGCTWLMLGGGTTSAADDSLLAFKAGFSKHRFMARNYRRVFDGDAYMRLCGEAGCYPQDGGFFPAYRAAEAA